MKLQVPFSICLLLTILLLMLAPHTVPAQYDYEYNYFSDQLSREHRDAGDVEDWIERGNATVTASPRFESGVRLAAWASESKNTESYEFAIASAIYLFEIPRRAQYVEILVRYRGEPHRADFDHEDIAGRVWIRNTKREYSRRQYGNNDEETLYGDTFFLRAKRRSETIKVATAGRVENGSLEMHIVAENGEQLDIEYVDVVTYQRQPDVRVIHRYARDYHWKPWHRYTYLYFYDGPFYYCTDLGYYIRWSYPVYDHHYVTIRRTYGTYLHDYYRRYPRRYHRNSYYHAGVHVVDKSPKTQRLNRWTDAHETTRREYSRSRLSVTTSKTNSANVRTRVRSLITEHRQTPVRTDRDIQRSAVSRKRGLRDTRREPNTTIEQQRSNQRSSRDVSSRSYRATQQIQKRKRLSTVEREPRSNVQSRNVPPQARQYDRYRFAPKNQRSSDNEVSTRSNAERRARLYNRTQSSRSRLSTPPSRSRSSTVKQRTETRSRVKQSRSRSSTSRSSTATTPRTKRPTVQQTKSSSSSKDDDDEKQERSRTTTRTQTRSRRK